MPKPWFEKWFDSPYYHLLYSNHDDSEANQFVERFLDFYDLAADQRVLDLACGRGRFSRIFSQSAAAREVIGLDLSPANIEYARQFESESLSFYKHDMRQPYRTNYFDLVFNMFTSFGYFETESDHLRTLKNMTNSLKPGGLFVLDYFNTEKVVQSLPVREVKTVGGIDFHLQKKLSGGFIQKTIAFEADGRKHRYTERVRAFTLEDLVDMVAKSGMVVREIFGDYSLGGEMRSGSPWKPVPTGSYIFAPGGHAIYAIAMHGFERKASPRSIIVAQK